MNLSRIARFTRPAARLALAGALIAAAPATATPLRARCADYELQVLVAGSPVPSFEHRGETWALGQLGDRYTLRLVNRTGRRVEAVVSVDGRDVINGRSGDWSENRGYLLPPWGEITIDGFRVSSAQAAAFRFSTVADSYAARTGSARDVGVIGAAFFPEREPRPRPLQAPPQARRGEAEDGDASGAGASRDQAPRAEQAPAAPEAGGAAEASGGVGNEAKAESQRRQDRPGLGTEYGEAVDSPVRQVSFARASSRPAAVLGLRYNDRRGLRAAGIDVDGCWPCAEADLRRSAEPFPESHRDYAPPPAGWRGR